MEDNYNTIQTDNMEPENDREFSARQKFWISFIIGVLCTLILVAGVLFALIRTDKVMLMKGSDWKYFKELDKNYGKYSEIMKLIGQDPLIEVTEQQLSDDELKALVAGFGDPYAQYFTAEEYEEFLNSFVGNFVGIGVGIINVDGDLTVKSVFNNGPAAEAGIQMGDIILRVDGEAVTTVEDAVSKITGEQGTSVTVTIMREGQEMDFTLDREELDQESVAYYELENADNVGYIEIISFVKETDEDFKLAIRDLSNKGCDRFIIDLRNNGGGLTDSSVNVADYLLPACTIMTDVLKDGTETVYSSEASSADLDYVVLVNENTASASEILSAAIQDNNGGKIIGQKTFGKGVTQTVHRFNDGSALKYTVSEYYRPNGDKVQGIGITPDIVAEESAMMDTALEELGD